LRGIHFSQQMPELLKASVDLGPRRIRAVTEQSALPFVFSAPTCAAAGFRPSADRAPRTSGGEAADYLIMRPDE
jgi:hypothetical protein